MKTEKRKKEAGKKQIYHHYGFDYVQLEQQEKAREWKQQNNLAVVCSFSVDPFNSLKSFSQYEVLLLTILLWMKISG